MKERVRAPLRILVALTAATLLVVVSHRLAAREAWAGALAAVLLAAGLGLYGLAGAWPELIRPDWRYQVTRSGALYLLGIFVVAAGALGSGNNLLFLVLAAMLAAVLVSGLSSRLNLAELELQCAAPEQLFAGQPVPARLLLKNLKSWTPSFSLRLRMNLPGGVPSPEVYFPMIAGGETGSALVDLRFPRRGRYRQDTFTIESGFPFGFLMKRAWLRLPREIVVYPPVEAAPEIEAGLDRLSSHWEKAARGLGQDLYRIRPYQTGDSSRVVHWKASAHTGELKVREFTVEEDPRVELLFDAAVPGEADWPERFERGVELCAALAWRLHNQGTGLRFGSNGLGGERLENIYDILRYLALVEADEDGAPIEVEPSGWFQVIVAARVAQRPPHPESSCYWYYLEHPESKDQL